MKKIISIFLSAVICFGAFAAMPAFAASDSTIGYSKIYTAEQLDKVRDKLDGKYILMNDIDLSSYESWEPIGIIDEPFTGIFNGGGYSISNLTVSVTTDIRYDVKKSGVGLFGQVQNAEISNLDMENVNICVNMPYECGYSVGAIVGRGTDIAVSNCSASGNIDVTVGGSVYIGGLVGEAKDPEISNSFDRCVNYVDIKVTGRNEGFSIAVAQDNIVGGIAGDTNRQTYFSNCMNYGSISIYPIKGVIAGGIAGTCYEPLFSYNLGNAGDIYIESDGKAAGIFGRGYSARNCYNSGDITVTRTTVYTSEGGIIGYTLFEADPESTEVVSPVQNCYYINTTERAVANFDVPSPQGAKALTADEMKLQSSYEGFTFSESEWVMGEDGMPTIKLIRDTDDTSDNDKNILFDISAIFEKIIEVFTRIFSIFRK